MKFKILTRTSGKNITDFSEEGISKSMYFSLRDDVWRFQIENEITELPIDLKKIANKNHWSISSYEEIHDKELYFEAQKYYGMTLLGDDDKIYILYNPSIPVPVRRFTIAHEFGHIKLGHFATISHSSNYEVTINGLQEREANMFAARLLMPAIALHHLKISQTEEIMKLCKVSKSAAQFRLNRLQKTLNQKQKYDSSPLEQKVHQLLWDDLESKKKK